MKTIYHIFPAHMFHLSAQIIKAFSTQLMMFNHAFIVYSASEKEKDVYLELSKVINYSLMILQSPSEVRAYLKKNDNILVHSLIPPVTRTLILHHYKNVSVVCWGSGIKLNSFRNYLLYPIKFLLYHSFKNMITLMTPDADYLKKYYLIRNVHNQPYIGERELELERYLEKRVQSKSNKKPCIFIGNNHSCLTSYLDITRHYMLRLGNRGKICYMLNYDLDTNLPEYKELIEVCTKNNIIYEIDQQIYNLYEYAAYIDRCDIYICGEMRQTGLAAIYTALRLKKKIYLNGNNYNWIKQIGCYTHHINELKENNVDDLLRPEEESILESNYKIIKQFESLELKKNGWFHILDKLI